MDNGSETRSLITVHVLLSVSGPEALCFLLRSSTLGHSCIKLRYPLQIRRELRTSDDLMN